MQSVLRFSSKKGDIYFARATIKIEKKGLTAKKNQNTCKTQVKQYAWYMLNF